MREARLSRVAEVFAKGAAAEASFLPYKRGNGCWAAGEYVADCHESGALSSVKGGAKLPLASLHARPRAFHFTGKRVLFYKNRRAKPESLDRKVR